MTRRLRLLSGLLALAASAGTVPTRAADDAVVAAGEERPTLIVVVGAAGEDQYGVEFARQADRWKEIGAAAEARVVTIGLEGDPGERADLDALAATLAAERKDGLAELWLVLIGHGTFDGQEAKFNLRGMDLTPLALAMELQPFTRPLTLVNTASASAPFMPRLAGPGRVVVTATRSGHEQNYTRFGQYFADALADTRADLDKDGQTSLLEAFLSASHRVTEFYKAEGRLATEHALLDDNGDGLGTPPDWFRGVRAVRRARDNAAPDGTRAHQFHLVRSEAERKLSPEARARRDEIERQIAALRERKDKLFIDDYYRELETHLLALALIYDQEQD